MTKLLLGLLALGSFSLYAIEKTVDKRDTVVVEVTNSTLPSCQRGLDNLKQRLKNAGKVVIGTKKCTYLNSNYVLTGTVSYLKY